MRTATASLPNGAEPTPAAHADALAPGTRLGPYQLLAPLASGGMGHVWSAVRLGDFGFRRTVALKVMREELAVDPGFRRMFLDEARVVARLSHTNVVEVLDLGESGGVLYLAMALVEGASLAHLLAAHHDRGGGLVAPAVVARVVADVLRGLHAAHALRAEDGSALELVHRDVSPHNVLVGLDGVAKLTDFGVAKAAGAHGAMSRSHLKGKIAYMAPEQFRGEPVDRRADVFAVGVMLWELVAGARFPEDARTLGGRGEETPATIPHPADVTRGAHRGLGDVAMRAVRLDRDARFATAEAMADAVERVAEADALVLSPKAVAAWVAPLATPRVLEQRHDTEVQLARSGLERAGNEATPRRRRGMAIGASVLVVAALGIGVATRSGANREAGGKASASASASADAGTAPAGTTAATAATAATGTTATTATATPLVTVLPPTKPAPRPRIKAATPRPKYGNPYEGAP